MDHEGASQSVESVSFSFMTDEEIRKQSFVKITNPRLLDEVERPLPGGLYDPALGPLHDTTMCKTCEQRSANCPGHCGHIDLISPVYNPVLFPFLNKLLQVTCFFCHHFRADKGKVKKCITQMELIGKGDIVGAKRLDSVSLDEIMYPEETHTSCETKYSKVKCQNGKQLKVQQQQEWTSLQLTEVMSVLNDFLRSKSKKCKNCSSSNPKVSVLTFGWFQKVGASAESIRANVICHQDLSSAGESEGMTDVEDGETNFVGDDNTSKKRLNNKKGHRDQAAREFIKQKNDSSSQLLPSEVKDILENLWENEARLCTFIIDIHQKEYGRTKAGPSIFFMESVLVPPIRFRPPTRRGDSVTEHSQTVLLSKVLEANISLGEAHVNKEHRRILQRWLTLQQSINVLMDSRTAKGSGQKDVGHGICQRLEKKDGLFRQKMMGKRVDYACRSVISPDPYIAVNEIGIPPCFAVKLNYPERVTPWNVEQLRMAVINGPENHPGATHYVDNLSTNKLPANRKTRTSISRRLYSSRGAWVGQPGKNSDSDYEGKIVRRHVRDGDIVLVNRQPTLHKPSIMAHVVRVLKGEKTLRMHYANCSTYNADFDGDEMNVHFPQDEISRAEAYEIVNANNQYCRPSNGEPLRALIQDHIVSAVLLTKRDTFLTGDQFNQLLYCCGISDVRPKPFSMKSGQKVIFKCCEDKIDTSHPAILKPARLRTGKEVISAILNYITRGQPPITVEKEGKISRDFFKSTLSGNVAGGKKVKEWLDKADEEKMLVYKNDLVRGVIDKAQFGEYGLVHTVQELYGPNIAGVLLSALSRLFTAYLQMHGFTCGVDDLLIKQKNDEERRKQLESCETTGESVHRNFIGIKDENIEIAAAELQYNIEKIIRSDGESALSYLDRKMKNETNSKTNSGVVNELLSKGLLKPSGKNCISIMTTAGAKGSKVNFQQISSFLGQQELEGKRVPRMVSGKTLPCFQPWDWTARSGGFVSDRFLTGLRPQEYYFHCMAGREGLVDTAVKTSRSGYLQRCLMKNLESLKVSYDHTVRDADGSIVQFLYGEDGVDVHRTGFLTKFGALAQNEEIIATKIGQLGTFNDYISELPEALKEKADAFMRKLAKNQYSNNPVKSSNISDVIQKKLPTAGQANDFYDLVKQKFFLSLAQPGEPVGVLAAQSVGEPSTQMTLNTFHLAGRGEMNVTLGIPRLQEILMLASADIKTPIMTCPLRKDKTKEDAHRLADKLKKVTVADIVESMEVSVSPFSVQNDTVCRIYKLKMKLHLPSHYPHDTKITIEDWEDTLEVVFVRELEDSIQNHVTLLSRINGIKHYLQETPRSTNQSEVDEDVLASEPKARGGEDDDDSDEDEDAGAEDLGFDAQKKKLQSTDEMDYDDGSEEEPNEVEELLGTESEISHGDDEQEISDGEVLEVESVDKKKKEKKSESKKRKKVRAKRMTKDFDRAVVVKARGLEFEVHFKFTNEPHILLAEIAQTAAKKVYIQNPGKIRKCQVTDCTENQVIYYGDDPKKRLTISADQKSKIPALQTIGVDFKSFWKMEDDLDTNYVYSNNIDAVLKTYGVEAAREAIIREINHVFSSYSINVNKRHLSLIADYMTFSGEYRPMNRAGGIAESVSPFCKMSFETASKFIVGAALHGETDNLETPSARIILGVPAKVGTGSFDVMQKLEV